MLAIEPCGFEAAEPASTVRRPSTFWITHWAFSSYGTALATTSAVFSSWVVLALGAELRSYLVTGDGCHLFLWCYVMALDGSSPN